MKKPQHNNQEKPQHQNTVNQSAAPSTPRRGRATQRTGEAHTVKSSQGGSGIRRRLMNSDYDLLNEIQRRLFNANSTD